MNLCFDPEAFSGPVWIEASEIAQFFVLLADLDVFVASHMAISKVLSRFKITGTSYMTIWMGKIGLKGGNSDYKHPWLGCLTRGQMSKMTVVVSPT